MILGQVILNSNQDAFVEIKCFTAARFLDLIQIRIDKDLHAQVKVFSTGVLPLSIPFAPVINLALFFVPFYDNGLPDQVWIKMLLENLSGVDVQKKGRPWLW